MKQLILVFILAITSAVMLIGCGGNGDGGGGAIYACTFEERSTGCGGVNWSAWDTICYEFDISIFMFSVNNFPLILIQ